MQRRNVLRPQQTGLFQSAPKTPRWGELEPDLRERVAKLLARLLRDQRERDAERAVAESGDD
jgi:hypothetical protein